jgi:hypothetical protein
MHYDKLGVVATVCGKGTGQGKIKPDVDWNQTPEQEGSGGSCIGWAAVGGLGIKCTRGGLDVKVALRHEPLYFGCS